MKIIIRALTVILLISLTFSDVYAQQVTREQLLKLFYNANAAQRKGDIDTAINCYKEILTKSPGLPDPYLQLGNIFYGMTDDEKAQRKAHISYNQYLKLKPEADNASEIQQRIEQLEIRFQEQEQLAQVQVEADTLTVEPEVVPEINVAIAEETKPIFSVTIPVEQPDTLEVIQPIIEEKQVVATPQINKALTGRWASKAMGDNGREWWIADIVSKGDELWMQLSNNSFVLKEIQIANPETMQAQGKIYDDQYVFRFSITQSTTQYEENKKTDMSSIVEELFEMELEDLRSSFYAGKNSDSADAPVDITHNYYFSVYPSEGKLFGTYIYQNSKPGNSGNKEYALVMYRVPDNYAGFTYVPISDEQKSNNLEMRSLLNKKSLEASESASALNDLACMKASGIGIKKNMRMAVAHFMEASAKNNLFATLNLARLYQEGNGVERDIEKARNLYQRAFDTGYTDAMVLCGNAILEQLNGETDYPDALKCYEKAVLKRSPYAAYRMGWMYLEGVGVNMDEKRAWNYFQQSMQMQYPDAMAEVGVIYRDGTLVDKDMQKGVDLLLKAADKGNVRAMRELANMYLEGYGVEADFSKSKEWLRKAMLADEDIIGGFCSIKKQVESTLRGEE